ncbi:MAG: hypothetical protein QXF40_02105 [Metallosphaera sp.]
MARNKWDIKRVVEEETKKAVSQGLVTLEDGGRELQIDNRFTQTFSQLISMYYMNVLQSLSGGYFNPTAQYTSSTQIVPYVIPLDIEYTMPTNLTQALMISPRTLLKVVWDATLYSALWQFYATLSSTVPGLSLSNVKVRYIMPIELGGAYASGNVGPFGGANNSAPVISGTIRQLGTPSVSLNAGLNTNVANISLSQSTIQNVLMVIGSIKDRTIPQNAIGFLPYKNGTPMIGPDYTSNEPWLYVDWGIQDPNVDKTITEVGFLTPIMIKTGDTFSMSVYSLSTTTENLMFNGFIAYIAGR